jgi:hypothetical protein
MMWLAVMVEIAGVTPTDDARPIGNDWRKNYLRQS